MGRQLTDGEMGAVGIVDWEYTVSSTPMHCNIANLTYYSEKSKIPAYRDWCELPNGEVGFVCENNVGAVGKIQVEFAIGNTPSHNAQILRLEDYLPIEKLEGTASLPDTADIPHDITDDEINSFWQQAKQLLG